MSHPNSTQESSKCLCESFRSNMGAIFLFWKKNTVKVSLLVEFSKGQTKLKWFFQVIVSSKKWKNKFNFTTMIPQVDLFSFVFWRKLKRLKRPFEIIWPLRRAVVVIPVWGSQKIYNIQYFFLILESISYLFLHLDTTAGLL